MAPGPSAEAWLTPDVEGLLVDVAWRAIHAGLADARRLAVRAAEYPEPVREFRATFVTEIG